MKGHQDDGLEHLSCEERLRSGAVQPREEAAQRHLIGVDKYWKGKCKEPGGLKVMPGDKTRKNRHKHCA